MNAVSCTFDRRVAGGAIAAMVDHPAGRRSHAHARIVARAREWLAANLAEPITVDALVAAACTSRRTLHRAFVQVLGETPRDYVPRLRLERIRANYSLGKCGWGSIFYWCDLLLSRFHAIRP